MATASHGPNSFKGKIPDCIKSQTALPMIAWGCKGLAPLSVFPGIIQYG